MNSPHAQTTEPHRSYGVIANSAINHKRTTNTPGSTQQPGNKPQASTAVNDSENTVPTGRLFSSLTAGPNDVDQEDERKSSKGRYLGQSKTLKTYCSQQTAELVYLQLLAEVQQSQFDKGTAFRDKFATAFAAACPNDKHHWVSFFVRCQARLGMKVDRHFNVVCLATASGKPKSTRSDTS